MPNGPHYRTRAYRDAARYVRENAPPCYYCGKPSTTVEHLIPVALGGGDQDLVGACRPCNVKRGSALGNAIARANKRVRETAAPSRFFVSDKQDSNT